VDLIALLTAPLLWVADLVRGRRHVRVLVHRAFFLPESPWYYFVTVVNLSSREIQITHIWFDTNPQVHIVNPAARSRLA
jgi:hypothetical protein